MSAGAAALMAALSAALLVVGIGRALGASMPSRPRLPAPGRPGPLSRRPAGRRLAERLARRGIPLGAEAFVVLTGAAGLAAGALSYAVLRLPLAGVGAAAAVALVAAALVRSADRHHLERVESQLPGVAQQLAAALQAGLSLRQALARAARDGPEPVRSELARVVDELSLGGRLESALEGLVARAPLRDLRVMVTAILVQRSTGGNLARALSELAGRLDERAQLARELRGATAQARMTAWLVAALPALGGLVVEAVAPGTLSRTLGQGVGLVLLAAAIVLYGAGVACVRRIARVEP